MANLFNKCPACDGDGTVASQAPEWQAYFTNLDHGDGTVPEPLEAGPAVLNCAECHASGILVTDEGFHLATFLKHLGIPVCLPGETPAPDPLTARAKMVLDGLWGKGLPGPAVDLRPPVAG